MGTYSFDLSCACCAVKLLSVVNADAQLWKDNANNDGGHTVTCGICGDRYRTVDDGVSVSEGGGVKGHDVSRPRIDSVNIPFGPLAGGNVITLLGRSLDIGDLVVKFDGKLAPVVSSRTTASVSVTVPVGVYRLNVDEYLHTLVLSNISGSLPLRVSEAVTTTAGSTGIIRHIEGATHMVVFQTLSETLAEMVGTTLIGGARGTTAHISGANFVVCQDGEQVTGLSSGATGSVRSESFLVVDAPTGAFAPDELVQGTDSKAMVKLTDTPAYSGAVDVIVENEHGQRLVGGTLVDGYAYA